MTAFIKLEEAGIKTNMICIPYSGETWGVRLGTAAVTRRGLKSSQMNYIAQLFKKLLIEKSPSQKIRQQVEKLMKTYPIHRVHFAFDFETIEKKLFF